MGPMNGVIKVISPLDGSPAAKANIQPGDFIIRINNHMVDGMSLQEIVKKIRGPKGSKVKLTIMRQGQAPFQITLTRETIKIRNIKAKLYDKKIAYVRISQFQENTKKQLINALRRLQNKHEQSIQALIIDLRNNPGGLLHSAVDISDAFLDSRTLGRNQLIVYAKGRDNQISLQSKAHPGDWMAGKPIIIIINGGSASASEVVAGALQDHRRAIILGTKSFGKGSVQTVIPINRDSAIKLTTHLYYTPMGKQIQAKGIKPNVVVHDAQLTHSKQKSKIDPVHESQLRGHLEQSQHNNRTHSTELNDVNSKLARKDYQLYQALNLAKGLVVSQHRKQPQRA
jgi:carboxyl-terminal processing protease